jgi:hypothetical protein
LDLPSLSMFVLADCADSDVDCCCHGWFPNSVGLRWFVLVYVGLEFLPYRVHPVKSSDIAIAGPYW